MVSQKRRNKIRNLAIIAHVDHGKTTIVDAMLKYTGAYDFKPGEEAIMDSNPLEKERGITILSKNASLEFEGIHFNIVDTPGHADFGSEVERILKMVDGALLLVDAGEGPMPQTKFVLKKALELNLQPILVINKMDRANVDHDEVVNTTFDLFCELNATEEQLDFPIVYASGKDGYATLDPNGAKESIRPLLKAIVDSVLPPVADPEKPFQMLVTMLDYDTYVGLIAVGRIFHGSVRLGEAVAVVKRDGTVQKASVTKIMKWKGLVRVEADEAFAGDIVSIAGIENIQIGETIAHPEKPEGLPRIKIDEPTISMVFSHNTSPLAGKDGGKFLTSRHIRERLEHEARINVGIKVEEANGGERFKVSGRGELHLSVLIETMRREGYEMEVSRPHVILKKREGAVLEPVEEVVIEVDEEYQGAVMQALGERKAEIKKIKSHSSGGVRMDFIIASRALIGFRSEFLIKTRGSGIMYQNFLEYQKYKGQMPLRQQGVLISQSAGEAVAYALFNLQMRGEIFINPKDAVYEGMIVGVHNKGSDLVVNALKGKKLTNMRASGSDDALQLIPPREITIESALEFISDDELVEITPKNIRFRKMQLNEQARKRTEKKGQSADIG